MATFSEYEELCARLRTAHTSASAEQLSKFLRLVRELRIRDSEATAKYGGQLLSSYRSTLSEEELAVAAMDIGSTDQAAALVRAIAKRFPDSNRMRRLKGMWWEAQGQHSQAEQIYKDILDNQPSNELALKRLVALEKSRGRLPEAVEALKAYLDVFSNDREGWEELGELYLEMLLYRQALFCYEELLMHAPGNLAYLIRYADLLYTLGGNGHLKLARSYYSKAVELSAGTNMRALWGVMMCSANVTDKVSLQDSRTRAQIELPELAARAVLKEYKTHAPNKVAVATAVLEAALPKTSGGS
ncbi:TPR_REGION domain-containing protein [Haematococcus lacustris]|uniref:ER membrane protein complex subunit 2 n=1 Tax=Haematococcus lacustris TaxID=44745 RepID=A0A699ZI50_HAELA|nr:TPR_REGION domain-containing protein [Haematococcus lacustris]